MVYIEKHLSEIGCILCQVLEQTDSPDNLIVWRGHRVYVILNRFPYTSGHLMVVPYDHLPSLHDLAPETRAEIIELADQAVCVLQQAYHPQGFNLGINIGEAAGAGITEHVHLHVVPRWNGDTNFMSTLGETRVLPESLTDTYHRIRQAWLSQSS